jgi:hypothetical protein
MFETPRMRGRVRLALAAFLLVWLPATVVLGVRWGRTLRLGGDSATPWGPIGEGILNFAFIMFVPCALVALAVFVVHAALTERGD